MLTHRHKTEKRIIGSHFVCLYAHMRKEITFYVILGEKRDPSKIYANSKLRNVTHITQKPSYVYVFHLHAQRNHSLNCVPYVGRPGGLSAIYTRNWSTK